MDANVLKTLSEDILKSVIIDNELYVKYDVKRGLRELSGKGVLAGLTEISEVRGTETKNGEVLPMEGELIYRGIEINKIIDGFTSEERFGFEETVYLLLIGKLPDKEQLKLFTEILSEYRNLPEGFIRDIMIKSPSRDVMNAMSRSVLSLYSYDENPDDTSLENVLRQSLYLISNFSLIAVYAYAVI